MTRADAPHPDGTRLGSVVGASGGLVFVLVNAGPVPGAPVWRLLAVAAALGVVALLLTRRTPPGPPSGPLSGPPPAPSALRVYLVSVAAMVVAIPAGAAVLGALDHADVVLPWVVLVVGAHFWPFAAAFGAPVFRALALVLVLAGLGGAAATLGGVDVAAPATGVVAGFALLGAAAAPHLGRRER